MFVYGAFTHGNPSYTLTSINKKKNTDLYLFSFFSKGFKKCVVVLLDRDAPIDPRDIAHTTPLHLTCQEGHHDVVRVLLDEGADITLCDHTGKNALDMAIERGHT